MAFPISRLFDSVCSSCEDATLLTQLCEEQGLRLAVDTAFLKEEEFGEVVGGDLRLAELLRLAAMQASPLMETWCRRGPRAGGGGGGVLPCGVILNHENLLPCGPPPGRAPHACVGVPGPAGALEVTGGPNPSVVRSTRLLRSFTVRSLKRGGKTPLAPPPGSVAERDAIRLKRAKVRIHQVMLRHYPTCARLRGFAPEDLDGSGSGSLEKFAVDGALENFAENLEKEGVHLCGLQRAVVLMMLLMMLMILSAMVEKLVRTLLHSVARELRCPQLPGGPSIVCTLKESGGGEW